MKPQQRHSSTLASCRGALVAIACFSGVINVLLLTGSLFMLQVYDRVLPSRSVPTLISLVVMVTILYGFQTILEFLRGRMLVRVGCALDERVCADTHRAIVQLAVRRAVPGDGLQPLRDLDQVRGFLSSAGPTALFDLPWMPLYLCACFLFHF